jgi:hypothetical protein
MQADPPGRLEHDDADEPTRPDGNEQAHKISVDREATDDDSAEGGSSWPVVRPTLEVGVAVSRRSRRDCPKRHLIQISWQSQGSPRRPTCRPVSRTHGPWGSTIPARVHGLAITSD